MVQTQGYEKEGQNRLLMELSVDEESRFLFRKDEKWLEITRILKIRSEMTLALTTVSLRI